MIASVDVNEELSESFGDGVLVKGFKMRPLI